MIPLIPDHPEFPAPNGFRVAGLEILAHSARAPVRVTHSDPIFRVTLTPEKTVVPGWYRLAIRFPHDGLIEVLAQISLANGDELWQRLPVLERNYFVLNVRCSSDLAQIALIVSGSGHALRPTDISFSQLTRASLLMVVAKRIRDAINRDGFAVVGTLWQAAFRLTRPDTAVISAGSSAISKEAPYEAWVRLFDEAPQRDRPLHLKRLQTLARRPLFSILATSQNPDPSAFDRLARSLLDQIYPEWQLIVAAPDALVGIIQDALSKEHANRSIEVLALAADCGTTRNLLAARATGEFLIPVPPDAIVRPHALLELALTLEAYHEAALIYSDEDQIGSDGKRQNPLFKPAWSPDFFDASDYMGNLTVVRRELVAAAGGWQDGLEEAGDYDLKLRIVDRIEPAKIIHLAQVLVHAAQRSATPETAGRAPIERAIRDHCVRRRVPADVVWADDAAAPRLKYRVPEPPPLVSLLIPTRDRADILETCVRSILTRTTYQPYEILIIDNDSREAATQRLFEKLRREPSIRILSHPGPFNFSALNNSAAREANGSIIGLLNNDLEVQDGGWLSEMVALVCRPEVGCVGCKLLYPDGRIQHAGVQLGPGGLAGHGYRFAAGDAAGYLNRLRMVQNVSAVTAACLLIRKSVFDQVGGLDESELKIALNDVDLCLKVRAAGYRNLWTPFAELLHHESISRGRDYSPAKAQRLLHEVNTFRRRWGPAIFSDPYYSPHLTYDGENFSLRAR